MGFRISFLCWGVLALVAPVALSQPVTIQPELFRCPDTKAAAVPRLINDLKSKDEKVRDKAIVTLGSFEAIAKPAAPALIDVAVNSRGHALALRALTRIDDDATRTALRKLLVGGFGRCKCGNTFLDVVSAAGEPIAPHLISLLAEKEYSFNVQVVLANIGAPALPHLIRSLESPNEAIRLGVCSSLNRLGPKAKAAAPALEKRMANEQGAARLHVAQTLFMVSGFHRAAFDLVHNAVKTGDKTQQAEALACLVQMQPKAIEVVPTIINVFLADEQRLYSDAMSVMLNVGKPAIPALIDALDKADAKHSPSLVYTLSNFGPQASAAIPTFVRLLDSKDASVAVMAASNLPRFGPDAKEAIPALKTALTSDHATLRRISAQALVQIDRQQIPHTVAPLIELLNGKDLSERHYALDLLMSFGPLARPALPVMLELLKTEKLAMRFRIAQALTRIDAGQIDAALPTVTEALRATGENSTLQRQAVHTLTTYGPRGKAAIPALKELLKESLKGRGVSPSTVITCLKKFDAASEIMPVLIDSLNSVDRDERDEAQYVVLDLVGAAAREPVEAAIANGQLRESAEVASLLKQLQKLPANP